MVGFNIISNDKNKYPYYLISIKFSLMDELHETTTVEISESKYNKYKEDVTGLLIYLYICYYSSENTRFNLNNYKHVEGKCYYDEYNDECGCGYDQIFESKKSKDNNVYYEHPHHEFLYTHPFNPEYYGDYYGYFKFKSIKIEYIDKKYVKHQVNIEFTQEDINEIVNGIIKSHTIKYESLDNKFNENDPQIFKDINLIIAKHEDQLNGLGFKEQKEIIMNLYENIGETKFYNLDERIDNDKFPR